jgi:hypothetical protein
MPDYAPTYTPRLRVKYRAAGVEHTMLLRAARGASMATTISQRESIFHGIFNAVASLLADDFTFITEDWAATDSDVFIPTGSLPAAVTGALATTTWTPEQKVTATTLSGKGTDGVKIHVAMYGLYWDRNDKTAPAANGLVTPGESTPVDNAIAAISGATTTISGTVATFYNQATIKTNDRLLKLVRRGTIS